MQTWGTSFAANFSSEAAGRDNDSNLNLRRSRRVGREAGGLSRLPFETQEHHTSIGILVFSGTMFPCSTSLEPVSLVPRLSYYRLVLGQTKKIDLHIRVKSTLLRPGLCRTLGDLITVLFASWLQVIAQEQKAKKIADIRGDIVKAEWGQQVRNYVFHPYKMIKDVRTGVETSDVAGVMDGDIDAFVTGFLRHQYKQHDAVLEAV